MKYLVLLVLKQTKTWKGVADVDGLWFCVHVCVIVQEYQRKEMFMLKPSTKVEQLDASHWPLLLKVRWWAVYIAVCIIFLSVTECICTLCLCYCTLCVTLSVSLAFSSFVCGHHLIVIILLDVTRRQWECRRKSERRYQLPQTYHQKRRIKQEHLAVVRLLLPTPNLLLPWTT